MKINKKIKGLRDKKSKLIIKKVNEKSFLKAIENNPTLQAVECKEANAVYEKITPAIEKQEDPKDIRESIVAENKEAVRSVSLDFTYEKACMIMRQKAEEKKLRLLNKMFFETGLKPKSASVKKKYDGVNILKPSTLPFEDSALSFLETALGGNLEAKGRLELKDRVSVLESDEEYSKGLLGRKARVLNIDEEFGSGYMPKCDYNNSNSTPKISLYYNDNRENAVYVVIKKVPPDYAIYEYIKHGTMIDMGVSMTMIMSPDKELVSTCMGDKERVDSVQLLRYDPYSSLSHPNKFEVLGFSGKTKELAEKYFKTKAKAPHFHFCSKTSSVAFNDSTKTNAITVPNLIKYCEDLASADEGDFIRKNDIGIPYIHLCKNPELYATEISTLENLARLHDGNKNIVALFKAAKQKADMSKDQKTVIIGLDAIITDLKMLNYLHENPEKSIESILDEQRYAEKICAGGLINLEFKKQLENSDKDVLSV